MSGKRSKIIRNLSFDVFHALNPRKRKPLRRIYRDMKKAYTRHEGIKYLEGVAK